MVPRDDPCDRAIVTGVITNITSRKTLERQLLSAGRFEALYAFAGRLAHDLNNPLMIVTGYAEELIEALKPGDPLREEAGEILGAARRIGGLAAQLTEFARPQAKPASRVNLGDAILNLRSKITAAAGERVAVELTVNRAAVLAMADPVQLGEVLAAVIAGRRPGQDPDHDRLGRRNGGRALVAHGFARRKVRSHHDSRRRAWTRCRPGSGRVRSRAEQDRGSGGAGPGARL